MDIASLNDDDLVYFAAMSLDGFVADAAGKQDWLEGYFVPELGFHDFMARIGGTVMGRATFDKIFGFGKWPYAGKPGTIVSDTALPDFEADLVAVSEPADAIVAAARKQSAGPWWLVGDAQLAGQMLEAGALTRIDMFIMPELLGSGTPALQLSGRTGLELISTQEYPKGTVRLSYRPRSTP